MEYQLPAESRIELVALRVAKPDQMIDFYTQIIGLTLIKRTENTAYLGLANRHVLITIRKIINPKSRDNVANIRSFALLLPRQDQLKKILMHINNLGVKISAVNTNAAWDWVELQDPEGNHFILIAQKPMAQAELLNDVNWLSQVDKKVETRNYLKNNKDRLKRLPIDTHLGWIEMGVANLADALTFYRDKLGFNVEMDQNGKAVLTIPSNTNQELVLYEDPELKPHGIENLGLDYLNIQMPHPRQINELNDHLKDSGNIIQFSSMDHLLFLADPDQMNLTFSLG